MNTDVANVASTAITAVTLLCVFYGLCITYIAKWALTGKGFLERREPGLDGGYQPIETTAPTPPKGGTAVTTLKT